MDQQKPIKIHKVSYIIVICLALLIGGFLLYEGIVWWNASSTVAAYQKSIQDFYQTPSPLPSSTPGYLIRSEKMDEVTVPNGGTAYRILYVTQKPNNELTVSSGMVFVPQGPVPNGGRKVIAWAHGTLGFGDDCTPSRSYNDQLRDMDNWIDGAMQRGYIVAATDYTGIGTAGDPYYLIGSSEAHDVLNSVRAAQQLPGSGAGNDIVTWGHSQGGHSALFAAQLASNYAPELNVKGVAAAAPAAELGSLFSQQYNTAVAWAIGPDAAVSWPLVYPNLDVNSVLTNGAKNNYQQLAHGCVQQQAIGLTIRSALNAQFFSVNPLTQSSWQQAASQQTPDPSKISVPIYVAQGLSDNVVLPNTTALLQQKVCQAGRTINVQWLGGITHQLVAITDGPNIMSWVQDRFNGLPAPTTCNQPQPITPANNP